MLRLFEVAQGNKAGDGFADDAAVREVMPNGLPVKQVGQ